MKPFSLELGPTYATYSNVASDGSVVIASGASALVATVPFTTGPFVLGSGMVAIVAYSFDAVSANGFLLSVRDAKSQDFALSSEAVLGGSPPTLDTTNTALDPLHALTFGHSSHTGGGSFSNFFTASESINGSGDLEMSFTVKATDGFSQSGQTWTFRNLTARVLVFGS
jgi:hypothetical protein